MKKIKEFLLALILPRKMVRFRTLNFFLSFAIILIASKASGTFKKVQEALDKVNTKLQENLSGVRVIKAYVRQKYEIAQFGSVNTNLTTINIRAVQLISLTFRLHYGQFFRFLLQFHHLHHICHT